ncbi:hypothetical protein Cni_G08839 [Canna indica]|uniref:BZIP domain-containing protein n=1 Tax=Canna indica TaxID=4628 RepID=A0AAQ3Q616_9LILI|nr:hypothetical protein Cni_G08839 [Canna indica]
MENSENHMVQQQQQRLFIAKQQQQNPLPMHPGFSAEAGKRPGVPSASPYSHFITPAPPLPQQQIPRPSSGPLHSRSRSHPALFSLDSLTPFSCRVDSPPTTSLSDSVSADVSMDDHDAPISGSPPLPPRNPTAAAAAIAPARDGLPPRKDHRRSQSDVPFAFFPPPMPLHAAGFLDSAKLAAGMKAEGGRWDCGLNADGVTSEDLFNAYMNLQGFDAMTSSEENHSRDSVSKTNAADSSENEADSNRKSGMGAMNAPMKEEMKRSAARDASANLSRHSRSLSMESFMGKFNFGEEPRKLQNSKTSSLDGAPDTFSLEFGNGQFTAAEMKKIMENEKLVEMAMADPKRVKRILANRQSAARSKERKMKYITELEHRVQALQSETTTLSAQLTMMQRDSAGIMSQNNELKFRLQAMEQHAHLKDALNEALSAEVQRLKLSFSELANAHQASINSQMFQLQQKQEPQQVPLYHLQKQQNDAVIDDTSEH